MRNRTSKTEVRPRGLPAREQGRRSGRAMIISASKVFGPPSFPLQYSTQIWWAARTVLPAARGKRGRGDGVGGGL